jgi:hypothetical protein
MKLSYKMDVFSKNNLNGKKLDELCIDIINTLGFVIKHPNVVKNIKILTKEQIINYEELIDIRNRDLTIYLVSFIFIQNDNEGEQKYPWKLQKILNNKQDLRDLINELYNIKQSVKLVKNYDDSEFIDVYYKYERYLPNF